MARVRLPTATVRMSLLTGSIAIHTQCGERDRRLRASASVMSPSLTALSKAVSYAFRRYPWLGRETRSCPGDSSTSPWRVLVRRRHRRSLPCRYDAREHHLFSRLPSCFPPELQLPLIG